VDSCYSIKNGKTRSSSESIMISVLSGRIGNQDSIPGRFKRFLLLHSVQTTSFHQTFPIGTRRKGDFSDIR